MFGRNSRKNRDHWTVLLSGGIIIFFGLVCVSSGQVLFVTNPDLGTIGEYNATTGAAINPALISGLSDPQAIAVSGSDIFVGCLDTAHTIGYVAEYTTSGQTVNAALLTQFSLPITALAASGSDLFVSSVAYPGPFQWGIGEYTTTGGTINANWPGGAPSYGIGFMGPNVVVSAYGTTGGGGLYEYTPAGALVTELYGGSDLGALAVSGSDAFVAVFSDDIAEFSSPSPGYSIGGWYGVFGTGLATYGSDLYVADGGVGEYSTSGATVNATFIPGLTDAYGIAIVPEPGRLVSAALFAALGLARRQRR